MQVIVIISKEVQDKAAAQTELAKYRTDATAKVTGIISEKIEVTQ